MTETDEPSANETFDPTQRRLCPDGACVGIIGPAGRCSVCGRTEAEADAGAAPHEAASEAPVGDDVVEPGLSAPAPTADGFDPRRRLCDDGSCVGVVGDDGKCRVCGRRAE